jgi:hypothetical protein
MDGFFTITPWGVDQVEQWLRTMTRQRDRCCVGSARLDSEEHEAGVVVGVAEA